MQSAPIAFGRVVQSVGPVLLPLSLSRDIRNADLGEAGAVARRAGMQHAISTQLQGRLSMVAGFENTDGTDVFVLIDEAGINVEP